MIKSFNIQLWFIPFNYPFCNYLFNSLYIHRRFNNFAGKEMRKKITVNSCKIICCKQTNGPLLFIAVFSAEFLADFFPSSQSGSLLNSTEYSDAVIYKAYFSSKCLDFLIISSSFLYYAYDM